MDVATQPELGVSFAEGRVVFIHLLLGVAPALINRNLADAAQGPTLLRVHAGGPTTLIRQAGGRKVRLLLNGTVREA